MKKILLALLFMASTSQAVQLATVYNPFTGKPDYINTSSGTTAGNPALPFNSVQYNHSGSFAGSSQYTTDGSSISVSTITFNGSPAWLVLSPFVASSGTVNGTFGIFSSSTPATRFDAIDNPLVFMQLQAPIGSYAGAQTQTLLVDMLDTGTNTDALNDGIAIHAIARHTSSSNSQMIAIWADTYCQGPGSPNCVAIYAVPAWASDLPQGTTTPMIGINITPRITNLAGTVPRSTGTLIGINFPDWTAGTGAPGKNWIIHSDNPFPITLNGPIGIKQDDPQAYLSVASDGTNPFVVIFGTVAVGSKATMTSDKYVMAVSTFGHVIIAGPSPSISSCGSSPSVAGTDRGGIITIGGGTVTACTLTFAKSYGSGCSVACQITPSAAVISDITSVSAAAITFGFSSSLGGGTAHYHCEGFGSSACR